MRVGAALAAVVVGLVSMANATVESNALSAPATVAPELEGLDEYIEDLLEEWKVPGAAIAVVEDGEVIHLKGYGYRDLENELPVTTTTLFPIGSITKSFAAVTYGILVDEGRLDWDTPVREYVPDFRLYDPVATARVTLRDLMSHRTGLAGHDFFMYRSGFTQREMFERLRYLPPSADLRTTFQYSNLMFMIAGYMVRPLTDTTWEEFTRERVLLPLGMDRTNFSAHEMQQGNDFALGYREDDDVISRVRNLMLDFEEEGAAGVINSNAEDMSRYLLFHLNRGKAGDTQVLSQKNAAEMQVPQITWTGWSEAERRQLEIDHMTYGLGLALTTYRGHRSVLHRGGFAGFHAGMTFLPEEEIGIAVLTNLTPNPLPDIVINEVSDRLLGLESINWSGRYRKLDQTSAGAEEDSAKSVTDTNRTSGPSHRLEDYVGEYEHPGYGVMRIELRDGGLVISNRVVSSPLTHLYYDVFEFLPDPLYPDWAIKLRFDTNLRGEIDQLSSPLEPAVEDILFKRRKPEL